MEKRREEEISRAEAEKQHQKRQELLVDQHRTLLDLALVRPRTVQVFSITHRMRHTICISTTKAIAHKAGSPHQIFTDINSPNITICLLSFRSLHPLQEMRSCGLAPLLWHSGQSDVSSELCSRALRTSKPSDAQKRNNSYRGNLFARFRSVMIRSIPAGGRSHEMHKQDKGPGEQQAGRHNGTKSRTTPTLSPCHFASNTPF